MHIDFQKELLSKKFKTFSVYLREDGLMQITIDPEVEVSIEETIEGTDYIMSIVKNYQFPVLFIAHEYSVPSKETREFLAQKEALPYSLADAYVISSFSQKIIGNFYLRVNKPGRPTRIFTDEGEAIAWLKQYY